MTSIRHIIDEFLKQNEAERRLSSHSLRGYRQDLVEFLNYLGTQGVEETGQLDLPLLRGFLAQLHKKNKKSTVARKMAALRSCFGYAQKKGWIVENPIAQVRTPKIEKTIPPFLSEKEVGILLQEPVYRFLIGTPGSGFSGTFLCLGIAFNGINPFGLEFPGSFPRITPGGRKRGEGKNGPHGAEGHRIFNDLSTRPETGRTARGIQDCRSSGGIPEPVWETGQRSDHCPSG